MSLLPFRQTSSPLPVKFKRTLKCSRVKSADSTLPGRWAALQREMSDVIQSRPAYGNVLVEGFANVLHDTMPGAPSDLRRALPPIIDQLQVVALRAPEHLAEVAAHLQAIIADLHDGDDEGPTPQVGQQGGGH